MGGHRDLLVWQRAMKLVKDIYANTADFPRHELYGLASQLRRAAVSVPSNLAEGASRNSTGEFRQFIGNARGSLAEVETQLEIARDLGYLSADVAERILHEVDEISRMLAGLRDWTDRAAS
jgi:four helix bundle protein